MSSMSTRLLGAARGGADGFGGTAMETLLERVARLEQAERAAVRRLRRWQGAMAALVLLALPIALGRPGGAEAGGQDKGLAAGGGIGGEQRQRGGPDRRPAGGAGQRD